MKAGRTGEGQRWDQMEEEGLIRAVCLINLKGTEFGNEKYLFSIHDLGELIWFEQKKKKKKAGESTCLY